MLLAVKAAPPAPAVWALGVRAVPTYRRFPYLAELPPRPVFMEYFRNAALIRAKGRASVQTRPTYL